MPMHLESSVAFHQGPWLLSLWHIISGLAILLREASLLLSVLVHRLHKVFAQNAAIMTHTVVYCHRGRHQGFLGDILSHTHPCTSYPNDITTSTVYTVVLMKFKCRLQTSVLT